MTASLYELEAINAKRSCRDMALEAERLQFDQGDYVHGSMNNDTLFKLTGELIIESGFDEKEKRIARELFERSLYYQLFNGVFDLRLNQNI